MSWIIWAKEIAGLIGALGTAAIVLWFIAVFVVKLGLMVSGKTLTLDLKDRKNKEKHSRLADKVMHERNDEHSIRD